VQHKLTDKLFELISGLIVINYFDIAFFDYFLEYDLRGIEEFLSFFYFYLKIGYVKWLPVEDKQFDESFFHVNKLEAVLWNVYNANILHDFFPANLNFDFLCDKISLDISIFYKDSNIVGFLDHLALWCLLLTKDEFHFVTTYLLTVFLKDFFLRITYFLEQLDFFVFLKSFRFSVFKFYKYNMHKFIYMNAFSRFVGSNKWGFFF